MQTAKAKMQLRLRHILFVTCCFGIMLLALADRNTDFLAFQSILQPQPLEHYDIVINEIMPFNRGLIQARDGGFFGFIELYNNSEVAVNLKGFGLSDDAQKPFRWVFPEMLLEPYSFITVWTSGKNRLINDKSAHANFKLNANDNVVVLTSPTGAWHTALLFERISENQSYGRLPDGSDALYRFDGCTPGAKNDLEPLEKGKSMQRLSAPVFNLPAGFYEDDVMLEISCEEGAEVRYTLDGAEPQRDSALFAGPLRLEKRTEPYVIRARTFRPGYPKSNVVTRTYFVGDDPKERYGGIPVISLATSPANLYDYEIGIYVPGKVRDEWLATHPKVAAELETPEEAEGSPEWGLPANYNQKGKLWERPAHLELFDPDGMLCLSQGIGIRTHGGYSLDQSNKSLRLLADEDYDHEEARNVFAYDFFSEGTGKCLPLSGLILRNSATDARYSLFRDAFIQSLADPNRLDLQASRPCIAFINGEYFGIYNIRPLYNADYLARKYGFNADDVVIIKNPTGGIGDEIQEGFVGDEFPYNKLHNFIKSSDMRKPENYAYVKTQIDIANYIEYNILEIYCGNSDWLANNVRIWRKRTQAFEPNAPYGQDGRWRWLVYDLDTAFGLFYKSYEENSLAHATAVGSELWYNTDEFTVMLRALLTNEEFRSQFITRFLDLLNTSYSAETAQERLEAMLEIYLPYVPQHLMRWNMHRGSLERYLREIERMQKYAENRPDAVRGHLKEYFGLSEMNWIEISISGNGSVQLNTLSLAAGDSPFKGAYFADLPVTLEAIPAQGYRFAGWESDSRVGSEGGWKSENWDGGDSGGGQNDSWESENSDGGWKDATILSKDKKLSLKLTSPTRLRAVFVPSSPQKKADRP